MDSQDKNNIEDYLKCIICLNSLESPKMCTECQRLFCSNCLDKYFLSSINESCPHCRKFPSSFLKLKTLTNVITLLIELTQVECNRHKSKFTYYCSSCNEFLCNTCLIELLQSTKQIKCNFDCLSKISETDKIFNEKKNTIELLINSSNVNKKIIEERISICEEQIRKINEVEIKFKKWSLIQKELLAQQIETYNNQIQEIDSFLQTNSSFSFGKNQVDFIKGYEDFRENLTKTISKFQPQILKETDNDSNFRDVIFYIKYDECNGEFDLLVSETIEIFGNEWYLEIEEYENYKKKENISVYLHLWSKLKKEQEFYISIELCNEDVSKNVKKSKSYKFKSREKIGWTDFITRKEFEDNGFFHSQGHYKVKLSIRLKTFQESYLENSNILDELISKMNEIKIKL